jgi:hypothetical protein
LALVLVRCLQLFKAASHLKALSWELYPAVLVLACLILSVALWRLHRLTLSGLCNPTLVDRQPWVLD